MQATMLGDRPTKHRGEEAMLRRETPQGPSPEGVAGLEVERQRAEGERRQVRLEHPTAAAAAAAAANVKVVSAWPTQLED
jgi:hypothetical protein